MVNKTHSELQEGGSLVYLKIGMVSQRLNEGVCSVVV